MKVGYTKSMINPDLPCHMQGYQDRISLGQHDNLYLHTLYIENGEPLLIHVLDVIIIDLSFSETLKDILSKTFHLKKDNILISCIHTHSGPKVSTFLDSDIPVDQEYINLLKKKVIENTKYVIDYQANAKVFIGTTSIDHFYSNRNGLNLPFYNQAMLLRFETIDHQSIVDFVNMACHPTILNGSNLYVSSDYVGVMRDEYEKLTHRPLMFSNAECGDVSTRLLRQGSGFDEVDRVGKGIAKILSKIELKNELNFSNMVVKSNIFEIDYKPKEDWFMNDMLPKLKNPTQYFDENDQRRWMAEMFVSKLEDKLKKDYIQLSIKTYVVEYDDFRIVAIPGELVYELGYRLRNVDHKPMFIIAYTNDFHGYAVDEKEYGKYFETFMSEYPYGKADLMIEETIQLFCSERRIYGEL